VALAPAPLVTPPIPPENVMTIDFAIRSLLTGSALVAALLVDDAQAQCQLATRHLFGTNNPVVLNTEWPGEYLVPGTLTRFQAHNSMNGLALLAMSQAPFSAALPAPHVGTLLVNPTQVATLPGALAQTHWSIGVPPQPSLLGEHFLFQSFHEQAAVFHASNGVDLGVGQFASDVAITGIQPPSNIVGGDGPRPFVVTYHNYGPAPASFQVGVAIGFGPGGTAAAANVSVGGNQSGSVTIWTPIPQAFGNAGTSVSFTVNANTAFLDCHPGNNQVTTTVPIAVPYWDLRLTIAGVSPTLFVPFFGTTLDYQVRVKNHGNADSGNYDFFNQINCSSGQGVYGCTPNVPINFWTMPPVPAGATHTYDVSYSVPGNVWHQTQWVKAEITNGDVIGTGNFAQVPITFY
jgi:hypothetical protein